MTYRAPRRTRDFGHRDLALAVFRYAERKAQAVVSNSAG